MQILEIIWKQISEIYEFWEAADNSERWMGVNKLLKSLTEKAYQHIKNAILSNQYKPGEVLSENQLAEELGISRTPIREAIKVLTNEGFVKIYPYRGIFVSEISITTIQEIMEARMALELTAIRKAAKSVTEQDKIQLQAIFNKMSTYLNNNEYELFHEADKEFHGFILQVGGNTYIHDLVEKINERMYHIRLINTKLPGRLSVATTEHEKILKALLSNDVTLAHDAMQEHLENMTERVVNYIQRARYLPADE